MRSGGLELRHVSFAWNPNSPAAIEVTDDLDLSIGSGSLTAILGPTGCGKSTVLQLAAGLEMPISGEILWNGKFVSGPSHERGLIFQSPKLFPWATVRANAEWGLKMRGVDHVKRKRISDEILKNVGLYQWENRRVNELSGGMQQRLAFARTLANDCELILMDEPFTGLDVQTRMLMQRFTVATWQETKKTLLMVTHAIDEAMIAERVIVLSRRPAKIVEDVAIQLPRPRDIQSPEFIALHSRLSRAIEKEVMAAASEEGSWNAAINANPVWLANGAQG